MLFYTEYENFDPIPRIEETLRVFKSRPLRRIYEPEREEVPFGWRKFYNEGLHDLYS
jgi:hypothetical protein